MEKLTASGAGFAGGVRRTKGEPEGGRRREPSRNVSRLRHVEPIDGAQLLRFACVEQIMWYGKWLKGQKNILTRVNLDSLRATNRSN